MVCALTGAGAYIELETGSSDLDNRDRKRGRGEKALRI
jgi:hypothetical protein